MTAARFLPLTCIALVAQLFVASAGFAQDWTGMMQATFDNITYTNLTNVGVASMCAHEGVCDEDSAEAGAAAKPAEDWITAAKLASRDSVDPEPMYYRRDKAVTAQVEAEILAEARRRNPAAAAELEAAFARQDMVAAFDQGLQSYGLEADNLVDVLALYWVLNWMVANEIPGDGSYNPSTTQVRAVRDQLGRAVAYNPALEAISGVDRQKLADSLIYNFLILDGAHTQASLPGKEVYLRRLGEAWRRHAEAFLGVDLRELDLTNQGFVPKG